MTSGWRSPVLVGLLLTLLDTIAADTWNTAHIDEALVQASVFATRSYYAGGPTCVLSDDGQVCLCYYTAGIQPAGGNTNSTFSSRDPAFFFRLPDYDANRGSRFVAVTVASDVWLLTDAGDIVVLLGVSADERPGPPATDERQWQPGFIDAGLDPVLALSVHPFPVYGPMATDAALGRREFCALRTDGAVTCHALTLPPDGLANLADSQWRDGPGWYDVTANVTASDVCGTGAADGLCVFSGTPASQVRESLGSVIAVLDSRPCPLGELDGFAGLTGDGSSACTAGVSELCSVLWAGETGVFSGRREGEGACQTASSCRRHSFSAVDAAKPPDMRGGVRTAELLDAAEASSVAREARLS
jgi:hypothetical protein